VEEFKSLARCGLAQVAWIEGARGEARIAVAGARAGCIFKPTIDGKVKIPVQN